jgi:hypothetical protein
MVRHQIITRALLKAKGRRLPEFFGLDEASFRELTILGHHCEKELGLSITSLGALGPNGRKGVRLSLSGKRAYSVLLSPLAVSLESGPIGGQPRQVFRNNSFDHPVAGQLFKTIETQEKQWLI